MYPVTHLNKVKLMNLLSLSQSSTSEKVFCILPVIEIQSIAVAQHWHTIAFQVYTIHAKILEIERVLHLTARAVSVAHKTNND